jgi:hypothetical protein
MIKMFVITTGEAIVVLRSMASRTGYTNPKAQHLGNLQKQGT